MNGVRNIYQFLIVPLSKLAAVAYKSSEAKTRIIIRIVVIILTFTVPVTRNGVIAKKFLFEAVEVLHSFDLFLGSL